MAKAGHIKPTAAAVALVLLLVLLLSACSGEESDPEAEIRRYLERGVAAAEERSASRLDEMIHPDYLDQRGYNRAQLGKLLRGYFFRHKNIYLFTRIDRIDLFAEDQAVVDLHLAMAGQVIADVESLSRIAARVYRLELHLVRSGDDWVLKHSKWAPATITDLG